MKFTFVPHVDRDLLERTKGAWSQQLSENPENASATYYDAALDYCGRTVDGKTLTADGGGCLCAVVENGRDSAAALLVVSHAKARSDKAFLKMLDVYVQPNLNLADSEPNYSELAWIAATAIIGCLGLTYDDFPSHQLKLHTAFPLDTAFMSAITAVIFGQGELAEHYEVSHQSNWLVVTKKPGANGTHLRGV